MMINGNYLQVILEFGPRAGSQSDAIIWFVREGMDVTHAGLPSELVETVARLSASGVFRGKRGEVEALPLRSDDAAASWALVVGLGSDDGAPVAWREAGVYAARYAAKRRLASAAVALSAYAGVSGGGGAGESLGGRSAWLERAAALLEGLALGGYRQQSYRRQASAPFQLQRATLQLPLVLAGDPALEQRLQAALIAADAVRYARDLTNLPGNKLVPDQLAQEAKQIAMRHHFRCIVHDEHEIIELGMLGLHHVGKGSIQPPRMIVLQYDGAPESDERLGLVGKGITFDAGGISIKPSAGMEEMISDMGGAAVLLAVMDAIGQLRPHVNVTMVIPAAENMPSGGALKPGDIIPTMSGRTVEVLNTDAEGRLVLADGVTYAKRLGATQIIDIATLTGSILHTFGDVTTGAVANHEPFLQQLLESAKQTGEKLWSLPSFPEYWELVKSEVADLRNTTGSTKWAGAITGGLFIGVFAEDTPWIHLDIAGTAWLWSERGTEPKGGTGVMVRTLIHFVNQIA
jgi:leucyl aminopeptidase